MSLDPRTPVLVGAATSTTPCQPWQMMAAALMEAAQDAGCPSLLAAIDWIGVPQGTWPYRNPGHLVSQAVGARQATTCFAELGVSQQAVINAALSAISQGHRDVAAVVGGEARAYQKRGHEVNEPESDDRHRQPDERLARKPDIVVAAEQAVGLVLPPVQQYAVIENALRYADHQSTESHRIEVATLWSRFSEVAATNPDAAFPERRRAQEIDRPGPKNRPLAFPYNRWHASQWTVDQAGALIFCSLEAARRFLISSDYFVFPLVALEADHSVSLSARQDMASWPAMEVLGRAAENRLGQALKELDPVEIYSCFPSAVRVQQRALALDPGAVPTITGGMAFAGGPFNNFTYQALAAMVPQLRASPERRGVVSTVCGLLTKPGLAVWSARPDGRPALVADLAYEASQAAVSMDVIEGYEGPASVASYTVTYDGLQPSRTAVVADIKDGRRTVAVSEDPDLAVEATCHELIGRQIDVSGRRFRA